MKVEKKSITVMMPVETKKIVLELSENEATVLFSVARCIAGSTPERHFMDGLVRSLGSQGIRFLRAAPGTKNPDGTERRRVMQNGCNVLEFAPLGIALVAENMDGDTIPWDRSKPVTE